MFYNIKVIKEVNQDTPVTNNYPCVHYSTREVAPDSQAAREDLCRVGTTVELGPPTRRSFHVPSEDADVIYVESEGHTIAKYPRDYIPPSKREKSNNGGNSVKAEFRVTEDSKVSTKVGEK